MKKQHSYILPVRQAGHTFIHSFNRVWLYGCMVVCFALPALAQFTTDRDTLVILSGDSTTYYYEDGDTTAGYDLNGRILFVVDFDTTAAFTAAKFFIQTSATYNSAADTSGGTPYDWKPVHYEGDLYAFTPEVAGINILKPQLIYALKRYIRFGCYASGDAWETEAADRKLIPLIRSGF